MNSSFKCSLCRNALAALLLLTGLGFVNITSASTSSEVTLLEIIPSSDKEAERFDNIGGVVLASDGLIRFSDGVSGRLLTINHGATSAVSIGAKQGFFGGHTLGGIALLPDGFAAAKTSEDQIVVFDAKGDARYAVGESGDADGQLRRPSGVAYSGRGRLYIADTGNNRVSVFSTDGLFLFQIGQGVVLKPIAVAVDAQERIYVLEGTGRMSVFAHNGALLKQVGAAQFKFGEAPPMPTALAVDARGDVFLADKANGKIVLFDWQEGKIRSAFGSKGAGRGQFLEITALTAGDDGKLVVGDSGNKKLEVYRLSISHSTSGDDRLDNLRLPSVTKSDVIGSDCDSAFPLPSGDIVCLSQSEKAVVRLNRNGKVSGSFSGSFDRPVSLAGDARDVAVIDGDQVKIFDHEGHLRFAIGRSGSGDGEFDRPTGVFLGDKIYVSDTGNRRIQFFSREGVFLDKIVNQKGHAELFNRPGPLAVDSQNNLYVADNGDNKIRVLSERHELLFELGENEKSPQHFEHIQALTIDSDDNLYLLAGTRANKQMVQVYSGPKILFSFGAYAERNAGFTRATGLALTKAPRPALIVCDQGRRSLASYYFNPVPGRVAGLAIRGGVRQTVLHWQKLPSTFVARYRVYGATGGEAPYRMLAETADSSITVMHDQSDPYVVFRAAAVSTGGIEGIASQPREDLFQAGLVSYRNKKYAEAARLFGQGYQDDVANGEALQYLGQSLLRQGKSGEALRAFQDLTKIAGFETAGLNLQAEDLLEDKQYLAARSVLDQAQAAGHSDAHTYALCGEVGLALGDQVGAVDCLEKAAKLDDKNASIHFQLGQAYIKIGAVAKGLGEFDAAVALKPQDAAAWQQSGEAYQALNKHKEALERFDRALALDGANAAARLGAARSHIALKEYDQARSIALSLSGSPSNEAAGQYLLGVIALATNHPQDAVVALSKAGAKDPRNATTWLSLADAQLKLGNRPKVKDALRQAVKADPEAFDAHYRLGQLEAEDENSTAAAESFAKAVALQPGDYDARMAYAEILLALERYKDASDQGKEAARLAPKRTEPLVLLADDSHGQGKNGEAIEYLKKALLLNPSMPSLHLKLGQMYLENNVYDAAQGQLDKAVMLEPKNAEAYDLLGQLYMARRLFDPAIKAFSKAVELDPSAETKLHLNTAYAEKKRSLEFTDNAPRIVLEDLRLERVFSSAYKQYAHTPIARVKVKNLSTSDYKNLRLTLDIKGYMDFPSSQDVPLLKANETREFALPASFNNKILGIDEDTGVQAEIKLAFVQTGKESFAELTRPMTIYGKNAIQWANFDMVGSFITPKDDTLKDFVRRTVIQYAPSTTLNKNMVRAMTLFDVLAAYGVKYLPDPNSPYSQINSEQVDYVQFPRETLKVRSGDCDDLSVLLSAALENLGIETALVDVPGHLFLMFNTGVAAKDKDVIGLQDDLLVIREDTVWIPLEATMIATTFSEAWAEGARKYHEAEKAKTLHVVPVKNAWAHYMPATLAPTDYAIDAPAVDKVSPLVERERRILVTKNLERLIMPYRAMLAINPQDQTALLQIAITYAQNGLYEQAFKEFDRLLEMNPRSAEAHNDRGNIYYATGDYDRALDAYLYAEQLDPADGGIKINLALTQYQRGRIKEANEKFREAIALNKTLAGQYKSFNKLLVN